MCPDDVGVSYAFQIAPRMDQIEPKYRSNSETEKSCRRGFRPIPRMRYRTSHRAGAIISIWKRLVDAEYLAFFPVAFPGLCSEAIGKMNENLDWALRQRCNLLLQLE